MSNTGSRKQITFDLHQESLKQLYPHTEPPQNAQYYKKAYQDIRRFMTANGFEHRQYSVYVSAEKLTTLDVIGLMEQLAEQPRNFAPRDRAYSVPLTFRCSCSGRHCITCA